MKFTKSGLKVWTISQFICSIIILFMIPKFIQKEWIFSAIILFLAALLFIVNGCLAFNKLKKVFK